MAERRNGQPAWAYEMEIALTQQMTEIKESIPSEDRIRILAREEMGLASKTAWGVRSAFIAVFMFFVSVSTFMLTVFRGSPHVGGH